MKTTLIAITLLGAVFLSASAQSQTGTVAGTITNAQTGAPISGATVRLRNEQDTTQLRGAYTNPQGKFIVRDLAGGRWRAIVTAIGYRTLPVQTVAVAQGETATLTVALHEEALTLNGVTVTASRKMEKALEAPASVTVLNAEAIHATPTLTHVEHLRGVAVVDIAQKGLAQFEMVTRGFSNVFSGQLLTLVDGRNAGLPSLRANIPTLVPTTNSDMERMELVRGPGSALYGPNASAGVLNIITKSPLATQGTTVEFGSGFISDSASAAIGPVMQAAIRHAGLIGESVGYKISGQYSGGEDWSFTDSIETESRAAALAAGAAADTLNIGKREKNVERFGVDGRMDLVLSDNATLSLNAGYDQMVKGIELTDVGAAQGKGWSFAHAGARLHWGDLLVQGFLNKSDAGKTYLLRSGSAIVDRSQQIVGRVQHSAALSDQLGFTYGGDLFLTQPETEGTLTGRNEDDDNITEVGAYLQTEAHLLQNRLDLVLTGRLDLNNRLEDPVFSPRLALMYKLNQDQNLRLTFNTAYNTPTTNDLFLDLVFQRDVFGFGSISPDFGAAYGIDLRTLGVPESGFTFNQSNGSYLMHSKFADPSQPLPVSTAALWPIAVGVLAAQGVDISAIPAPTEEQVHSFMAILDPNDAQNPFKPIAAPSNTPRLKPTTTETIEFGYKGAIADRLQLSVDLYRSQIENFTVTEIITPNAFLNGAELAAYVQPFISGGLQQQGIPQEVADSIATAQAAMMGGTVGALPLGTISPANVPDPTALVAAPRNYGKVTITGVDLAADYRITDQWGIGLTYSFMSDNYFENVEGGNDLSLNAPKNKGSLAVRYADAGLRAEGRYRYTEGFRMKSGVYEGDIPSYGLVDLTLGYRIPGLQSLDLTLTAQNVLNNVHQEFMGAPAVGRSLLVRGSLSF